MLSSRASPSERWRLFMLALLSLSALGCSDENESTTKADTALASYELIETLPHDATRFTQGLEFYQGRLLESSGLYQQSYLTLDAMNPGAKKIRLPPNVFAEGLTVHEDKLYLLSWQNQLGFVLDPTSGKPLGTFVYQGQGWGICSDKQQLIMSNGSDELQLFQPSGVSGISRTGLINVTEAGQPVTNINELECVGDHVLANQWQTNDLLIINKTTGNVSQRLDLSSLYPVEQRSKNADVLNGIAWEAATGTLLVTGKRWPQMYRIRINSDYLSVLPKVPQGQ